MVKAGSKDQDKDAIIRETKRDMKSLGVYKSQYDRLIDIYAEQVIQFNRLNFEFVDSGYRFQSETAQGGAKKAPIVATLETLRKDILAYSDRLCLNPKALETVSVDKKKKSILSAALDKLK